VQARHALSTFVEKTIAVADYNDDIMFQVDVLRDRLTREQGQDSPNSHQYFFMILLPVSITNLFGRYQDILDSC
jgi:hypothetical protein